MARGGSRSGGSAGFSAAPRCLIRRWGELATWIAPDIAIERASGFARVALGTLLRRRVEPIDKIAEPIETLNVIAKVSFGGELFLRTGAAKRGYKGPLLRAHRGDLIISKIRVGQGSFCIIGDATAAIAVSPEYPVYTPNPNAVDADFLAICLRSREFLDRLGGAGNTTKRRISPVFFETLAIPLPSLDAQRALVAGYRAALARAEAAEAEAAAIEAGGIAAFEAALGLTAPAALPDRPIFIARFRDLDRWSHDAALRRASNVAAIATHPIVRLGDVIDDLTNGWSPKCLDRPARANEWGVLKLGAVSFGSFDETENKALPSTLSAPPRLEIKKGELLISRANVVRLVGATALIGAVKPRLLLCDKIFRVSPKVESPVDLGFLAQVMRSPSVRLQIESQLTGTSPTMKNISKPALLALTFPLPSRLVEQRKFVTELAQARAIAAALRKKAHIERANAWRDFEAALYHD